MAHVEALDHGETGRAAGRQENELSKSNARTAFRLWAFIVASVLASIVFRQDGRLVAVTVILVGLALLVVPALMALLFAPRAKAAASENGEQSEEGSIPAQDQAARSQVAGFDYDPTKVGQLRQTLTLTALQLWVLAALAIAAGAAKLKVFQDGLSVSIYFAVFAFAVLASLMSFGVEAVKDEKLPPRLGDKPEHKHITGFGALALIGAVVGIIVLATWATLDQSVNRHIHAQWGAWIVFVLALVFLFTAIVPSFSLPDWLGRLGVFAADILRPIGILLSVIDSLLVHSVAPAAGATLRRRWVGRYAYLAAYMIPLGLMGYWLPAPLGLVPIAWALIAAVSISRRWAWVEDDRETAMLTAQFRSENLRVGFNQDLRDEALLAFMSMFILVPLALRQAHDWGAALGAPVFEIEEGINTNHLFHWIQYFGAELAKAVPFVDWAEIYDVEGEGPIEMSSAVSRHVVFAARVLVDLVFLAALLQALSTLARNAKQIEMFMDGVVDRFDPFMEREQFQKLVVWDERRWVRKSPEFDVFGQRKYSLTRLLELKEDKLEALNQAGARRFDRRTPDWAVWAAAELLYARDYLDGDVVGELHAKLREEAGLDSRKAPNKDAVANILDELEKPNRLLEIDDLNDVREHLNAYKTAWLLRQRMIILIARNADDPNGENYQLQIPALAAALSGGKRMDPRAPNRRIAFVALKPAYLRGESEAVRAVQRAAQFDQAGALRKEIAGFVEQNQRAVGPGADPGPTA